MELLEQIKKDRLAARKATGGKRKLRARLLTTFVGEAEQIIKSPNVYSTQALLKKYKKNLEISLAVKDTVEQRAELKIIESYLPKQLTEQDLVDIISGYSLTTPNLGQIMKRLNNEYSGQFDGKIASTITKEVLNGGVPLT